MAPSKPKQYEKHIIRLESFLTEPEASYLDYKESMVVKSHYLDEDGNKDPNRYSFVVDINESHGYSISCDESSTGALKYLYDVLKAVTIDVTPDTPYITGQIYVPGLSDIVIVFDDVIDAVNGEFNIRRRSKETSAEEYEVIEGFGLF